MSDFTAEQFATFGRVETAALTKVQQLTGAYLSRNWQQIPHVFHQDEADVTALESYRAEFAKAHPDVKITSLAFQVKAVAAALIEFPRFCASLVDGGKSLALKHYYHIGIAIDTPKGLVVGVVRDVDRKTVPEIAAAIGALSTKARARGLSMDEMQGGCFSISSLGRDGGTSFTPIINAPEVAILGLSRLIERPARDGDGIAWRKMLSLSLSYDHRVINGADAAAFVSRLRQLLATPGADWAK
jgi:pyruvate dehydrogenase E2 component (dihydrolipoamide acetyltransferase)